ncbi:hypothetical protein CSC94_06070 [Zhengella mangrovi]|uniref:DUF6946 domain-containing protein n=1 Tax=Zhengella mangrovi TaxID=1982044 RepID=A0A2G1QRP9_9HYPH|nr:hypothetical protein [Zhengella mangrovi]PHP68217.1 hypothetical protein CSC94_06070 [Zhengella mangrovi]
MTRILVPSRGLESWQALLADPQRHWREGYSAMAVARSWEAARGLPPEIAGLFEPGVELLLAIPEHTVRLPGAGRASQCDVFALLRNGNESVAMAVEAKVSEPFGPTVGEWLAEGGSNRAERLAGLRALLGADAEPDPSLRYQLFHRTAAAVIEARRFAAPHACIVVQSFSANNAWLADFQAFARFLGLSLAPGEAGTVVLPDGMKLSLAWVRGAPAYP